jgi:hypothetical protein
VVLWVSRLWRWRSVGKWLWAEVWTECMRRNRNIARSRRRSGRCEFSALLEPAPHLAIVAATEFLQGPTVGSKPVGQDGLGPTMPLHRFLQELQSCLAIAGLGGDALPRLALMIDRPREGVCVTPLIFTKASSRCQFRCQCARIASTRLPRISAAIIGPNRLHQWRTVSWLTSTPRSCSRSSTFRRESGKRMQSITARRMI